MPTNWAEIHLLVNHIPELGTIFGLVLLAVAMKGGNEDRKRVALWTFFVVAVLSIGVYLTGDPASHAVRSLPGVSKSLIDSHDDSATYSLIALEALGVVSLAGLYLSRKSSRIPPPAITISFILAIITAVIVAWTSHLGGEIRHEESRTGFVVPARPSRQSQQVPPESNQRD